ncbi:ABC transporter permease subunit [Caballeronia sp. SEWSISQ10-4 2]|uniref:ABC transporter permease n=1 Tax=Caballeronia sp. SEWSISQ10-4 2 TaxID=2937438 RepID=UPI00264E9100|nr:ABC transporter permease subunit [Caballeronia sp. SEWSISQ10-4 2]MDN7179474.1 ABC transporter permease subunit [Caballeronia sp. SEWSISQ10-4 2]
MSWQAYLPLIARGAWTSVQLSLWALFIAFLLGLATAGAKLSGRPAAIFVARLYTTLIRGVPDLVLMLLLFYGIQRGLNWLTDLCGVELIQINPFAAGVMTLGFIYGAYFAETFRGAFTSVDCGQREAATSFGMTPSQSFRLVTFPLMMRFALPGISNNWQVLVKSTALVSIIGLSDVVKAAVDAGKGTYHVLLFMLLAAGLYLFWASLSGILLRQLSRRYSLGIRVAGL